MSDDDKKISGEWGSGTIYSDGSADFDHTAGKLRVSEDGYIKMDLDIIKKVNIEDLVYIKNHDIEQSDIAISHHIIWFSGTEVRLSFRKDGKLLEFSASNATTNITNDGVVTIGPRDEDDEATE